MWATRDAGSSHTPRGHVLQALLLLLSVLWARRISFEHLLKSPNNKRTIKYPEPYEKPHYSTIYKAYIWQALCSLFEAGSFVFANTRGYLLVWTSYLDEKYGRVVVCRILWRQGRVIDHTLCCLPQYPDFRQPHRPTFHSVKNCS